MRAAPHSNLILEGTPSRWALGQHRLPRSALLLGLPVCIGRSHGSVPPQRSVILDAELCEHADGEPAGVPLASHGKLDDLHPPRANVR